MLCGWFLAESAVVFPLATMAQDPVEQPNPRVGTSHKTHIDRMTSLGWPSVCIVAIASKRLNSTMKFLP